MRNFNVGALIGAETPQEIQAAATLFAGYLASIFAATLSGRGRPRRAQPA